MLLEVKEIAVNNRRAKVMMEYKGFYKVSEEGYGVAMGTFYNPETKEVFTRITWDIDRPYINDDEEIEILRYLPLDEHIRYQWRHENGIIQKNDIVKVIKGRKVKIGTIAKVLDIKPYYDCYKRWCCDYAYLDNGEKTNIDNLKLLDI